MNLTRRYKLSIIHNTVLTDVELDIIDDVKKFVSDLDKARNEFNNIKFRIFVDSYINTTYLKFGDYISLNDLRDFINYKIDYDIKQKEKNLK